MVSQEAELCSIQGYRPHTDAEFVWAGRPKAPQMFFLKAFTEINCIKKWYTNLGLCFRYRFHSRPGSVASLNIHSVPVRCIIRGACFFVMPKKTKTAPIPIMTQLIFPLCSAIQYSCFGHPKPTKRIFAPDSLISFTYLSSSAFDNFRKGGDMAHAIRSLGYCFLKKF